MSVSASVYVYVYVRVCVCVCVCVYVILRGLQCLHVDGHGLERVGVLVAHRHVPPGHVKVEVARALACGWFDFCGGADACRVGRAKLCLPPSRAYEYAARLSLGTNVGNETHSRMLRQSESKPPWRNMVMRT